MSRAKPWRQIGCYLALGVSIVASLRYGAAELSGQDIWQALLHRLSLAPAPAGLTETILFSLRLPRALTAALCGGALAVAGVLSQGLFRNSLASPSVLGSEAGGSVVAVTVSYFGAAAWHWLMLPLGAFAGALAVTAFVYAVATWRRPGDKEALLLTGFGLNALCGALTSLVISFALEDYQKVAEVVHWLLGGFGAKGWEHAAMVGGPFILGLLAALWIAPQLDVLTLGEEQAQTLSVDLPRLRRQTTVAIALLVGSSVAVAGAIPFVGLLVPHLTRGLFGPRHKPLVLLSAVNGMTLVLLADLIARTVLAPRELEVGILTSALGAPFFLWLLLRREAPK